MENVLKNKKLKFYDSLKQIGVSYNIFVVCVGLQLIQRKFKFEYLELYARLISHLKKNDYFIIIINATTRKNKKNICEEFQKI